MVMPPFVCQYCTISDAIIFCLHCGGRLCITCDFALHGAAAAAGLHARARLCDGCGAAPSVLCFENSGAVLCGGCAGRLVVAPAACTLVTQYTGCPTPAEMVRLLSVEPPQPLEDLARLAEKRREWEGTHAPPAPWLGLRSRL